MACSFICFLRLTYLVFKHSIHYFRDTVALHQATWHEARIRKEVVAIMDYQRRGLIHSVARSRLSQLIICLLLVLIGMPLVAHYYLSNIGSDSLHVHRLVLIHSLAWSRLSQLIICLLSVLIVTPLVAHYYLRVRSRIYEIGVSDLLREFGLIILPICDYFPKFPMTVV